MPETEVVRLPIPDRLEPKRTQRTLMVNVRMYFYQLYNTPDGKFRALLVSISNVDAVTGNRMFDRAEAVGMIKDAAKTAKDITTSGAKAGHIYRCLVNLMREHGLGLKLRRTEYLRLTHQQAAE